MSGEKKRDLREVVLAFGFPVEKAEAEALKRKLMPIAERALRDLENLLTYAESLVQLVSGVAGYLWNMGLEDDAYGLWHRLQDVLGKTLVREEYGTV